MGPEPASGPLEIDTDNRTLTPTSPWSWSAATDRFGWCSSGGATDKDESHDPAERGARALATEEGDSRRRPIADRVMREDRAAPQSGQGVDPADDELRLDCRG